MWDIAELCYKRLENSQNSVLWNEASQNLIKGDRGLPQLCFRSMRPRRILFHGIYEISQNLVIRDRGLAELCSMSYETSQNIVPGFLEPCRTLFQGVNDISQTFDQVDMRLRRTLIQLNVRPHRIWSSWIWAHENLSLEQETSQIYHIYFSARFWGLFGSDWWVAIYAKITIYSTISFFKADYTNVVVALSGGTQCSSCL